MKDKPGAAQQFRAAVKADPKMPDVHFGLGYLLWGQLQFDEAAKEFQAELDNNPDHPLALTYLGDCDMRLGHPDVVTPLLERAIQIDPKLEPQRERRPPGEYGHRLRRLPSHWPDIGAHLSLRR